MPIVYACVARGKKVVAESGLAKFKKLISTLLDRVEPRARKAYEHEGHSINYISHEGQVVLCVADRDYKSRICFAFLEKVMKDNIDDGGGLRQQMEYYSNERNVDKVAAIHKEIDSVKDIMMENIDAILQRGERLEDLMEKTDDIASRASEFKKQATDLKRAMWWKNIKLWIVIGIILVVVVLVIIFSVCGINFASCAPSSSSSPSPPPPSAEAPA